MLNFFPGMLTLVELVVGSYFEWGLQAAEVQLTEGTQRSAEPVSKSMM
jgi:hypothetical protein